MTSRFVGLAGFSRKLEKDPWNLEKDLRGNGQLCALLEGGTVTYMSPEQKWLLSELKKFDKGSEYSAYVALKEQWQITPAISDLFQVALTVLEMHARGSRWFGYGSITMQEAVRECASRTPVEKVRAMSPTEAERWVVDQLGIDKLAGKIESAGIDGGKLIDLPKLSLADAKKAHQGLSPPVHNKLKAVARNVSTPSDTMQEGIATMLEKCLAVGVGERPATAMDALKSLRRATWYDKIFKAKPEWYKMARSEATDTPTRPWQRRSVGSRRHSCSTAMRLARSRRAPSGWASHRTLVRHVRTRLLPTAISGSASAWIACAYSTSHAVRVATGARTCCAVRGLSSDSPKMWRGPMHRSSRSIFPSSRNSRGTFFLRLCSPAAFRRRT